MKMISVAGGAVLLIATLAGCGHDTPTTMGTGPSATGTGGGPHPAAATTEPCQLVTAQEASALSGTSYGPGTERTMATSYSDTNPVSLV